MIGARYTKPYMVNWSVLNDDFENVIAVLVIIFIYYLIKMYRSNT